MERERLQSKKRKKAPVLLPLPLGKKCRSEFGNLRICTPFRFVIPTSFSSQEFYHEPKNKKRRGREADLALEIHFRKKSRTEQFHDLHVEEKDKTPFAGSVSTKRRWRKFSRKAVTPKLPLDPVEVATSKQSEEVDAPLLSCPDSNDVVSVPPCTEDVLLEIEVCDSFQPCVDESLLLCPFVLEVAAVTSDSESVEVLVGLKDADFYHYSESFSLARLVGGVMADFPLMFQSEGVKCKFESVDSLFGDDPCFSFTEIHPSYGFSNCMRVLSPNSDPCLLGLVVKTFPTIDPGWDGMLKPPWFLPPQKGVLKGGNTDCTLPDFSKDPATFMSLKNYDGDGRSLIRDFNLCFRIIVEDDLWESYSELESDLDDGTRTNTKAEADSSPFDWYLAKPGGKVAGFPSSMMEPGIMLSSDGEWLWPLEDCCMLMEDFYKKRENLAINFASKEESTGGRWAKLFDSSRMSISSSFSRTRSVGITMIDPGGQTAPKRCFSDQVRVPFFFEKVLRVVDTGWGYAMIAGSVYLVDMIRGWKDDGPSPDRSFPIGECFFDTVPLIGQWSDAGETDDFAEELEWKADHSVLILMYKDDRWPEAEVLERSVSENITKEWIWGKRFWPTVFFFDRDTWSPKRGYEDRYLSNYRKGTSVVKTVFHSMIDGLYGCKVCLHNGVKVLSDCRGGDGMSTGGEKRRADAWLLVAERISSANQYRINDEEKEKKKQKYGSEGVKRKNRFDNQGGVDTAEPYQSYSPGLVRKQARVIK